MTNPRTATTTKTLSRAKRGLRRLADKRAAAVLREDAKIHCPECGLRIPPPSLSVRTGLLHSSDHAATMTAWPFRRSKAGVEYRKPMTIVAVRCKWDPEPGKAGSGVPL